MPAESDGLRLGRTRWPLALGLAALAVAIGGAVYLVSHREEPPPWNRARAQLHNTAIGVQLYSHAHGGQPAPELEMLLTDDRSDAYIDDPGFLTEWWGWRLVYRAAGLAAFDVEPILYLWPPGTHGHPEDLQSLLQMAGNDVGVWAQPIGPPDLAYAARRGRVGREPIPRDWRHTLVGAMRLYAVEHGGRQPHSLDELLDGNYISKEFVRGLSSEGFRFLTPQSGNPDELLGCQWPPKGGETNVSFMDGAVDSAQVEVELVNPRTGAAQRGVAEDEALQRPRGRGADAAHRRAEP